MSAGKLLRLIWASYGPDNERKRRLERLARLDVAAIERAARQG